MYVINQCYPNEFNLKINEKEKEKQFYWDKIHMPYKSLIEVYNSMVSTIFTDMCNNHHSQF